MREQSKLWQESECVLHAKPKQRSAQQPCLMLLRKAQERQSQTKGGDVFTVPKLESVILCSQMSNTGHARFNNHKKQAVWHTSGRHMRNRTHDPVSLISITTKLISPRAPSMGE